MELRMPSKRVVYECKYCGKDFEIWDECEEHEKSHLRNYRQADTNEIIRELNMSIALVAGKS